MDIDRRWLLAFLTTVAVGLSWASTSLAQTPTAKGGQAPMHNFGLRIEPGLAFPLTTPQSDRFDLGGGQTVKGYYNLTPWLDVGPTVSFSDLPAADGVARSGTAWDFGAGARLKGPGSGGKAIGMFPWFDADALYVRTGELDRFGFDTGAGLAFAFGAKRSFRLGPFVRYRHILQPDKSGFDNTDARLMHAGLSLEFGAPRGSTATAEPEPAPAPEPTRPEPPERPEPKPQKAEKKPDRDEDGVPDEFDPCPTIAGSKDNYGCPSGDKFVVTPNEIDLKERVFFDWDSTEIREESHDVLDAVAGVLKRNEGFEVRVIGHADATGLDGYNQVLSEKRAIAVVDYLVKQGVDRDRFVVRGYSSSRPVDTNLTDAGRKKNRRVEFVIDLAIMDFERSNRSEK